MDTNENKTGNTPQKAQPQKPAPQGEENRAARQKAEQSVKSAKQPPAQDTQRNSARRTSREEEKKPTRRTPPREGAAKPTRRTQPTGEKKDLPRRAAPSDEVKKPVRRAQEAAATSDVQEEVYRPKQDGRRRPASENAPERPAKKAPQKSQKKADEGYQPYKAANQRKKAQRAGEVRKFFSAQNPLLKKYANRDAFAEDTDEARKRKAGTAKKKKKQNPFSAPTVIYTDPLPFNRDRLLVQLLTIAAVVLAFVMGLAVFFKVDNITITGAEVYSPWTIQQAAGIQKGDNLLTFGRARTSGQIMANLPYVKSVRIGIKLPDTVNIEIQEEDVVYAIKSEDSTWWLMNSAGKVVEMSNNAQVKNYTQIAGVALAAPQVNEMAVAAEQIPTETGEDGELIPVLVTGAQRLDAVLRILRAMEDNDIVGEAASIDVSHINDIILWYGTRYQVNLGDTGELENKIAYMYDAILQMSEYDTGILDVSFTIRPNQIVYTPFQ